MFAVKQNLIQALDALNLPVIFEWNATKAKANLRKHAVSFEEAKTVFGDPLARIEDDPRHSAEEDRLVILGLSEQHRMLAVMFAERDLAIRIISARTATRAERKTYEEKPN